MFFSPIPRRTQRLQLQFSERKLVLAVGDLGAVFVAVIIALRIWTLVSGEPFTIDFIGLQSGWFVFLGIVWLLLASANDFYDLRVAAKRGRTLQRLLAIEAQLVVVYVLIFFFSPREALPRLFILYYGAASFGLIGAWRFARPAVLGWVSQPRRTLIVGGEQASRAMIAAIQEYAADEYEVRGIIDGVEQVGVTVAQVPVLGTGSDLMNYVRRDHISELIITATHELDEMTFRAVMEAYELGVTIMPMALLYERISGRVPVMYIHDDWAVVFAPARNGDYDFNPYPFVKRIVDLFLGLLVTIVFVLVLPVIALLIRLDSPGSVFYAQERLGRGGRPFRMYKFRSMVSDAEAQTGAVFSKKGDPRVTRFGRFMRKTRLDELPQVINVLRGEMSVVGPRPERPEHVERLTQKIPFYRTRLIVKPGLTGWAQVRYSYGSTDEDALVKLEYDLYYIRHQSFLLDVNIMMRTVGKVISMSGV